MAVHAVVVEIFQPGLKTDIIIHRAVAWFQPLKWEDWQLFFCLMPPGISNLWVLSDKTSYSFGSGKLKLAFFFYYFVIPERSKYVQLQYRLTHTVTGMMYVVSGPLFSPETLLRVSPTELNAPRLIIGTPTKQIINP